MRNLIPLLLAIVTLSSGCDSDGYSCILEGCYADDDSPQYQTLEDCLSFCAMPIKCCGDLVSHAGYDYSTVQIGDQCWFAENCRYLPEVSPSSEATNPNLHYFVYGYEGINVEAAKSTANYETYGVLYNWPAVMTEGVCPSGWHVPSDGEFTELTDFLVAESVAGGKMKSTSGWNDFSGSSGNGSNSSGWTGLPGGYCSPLGSFSSEGDWGSWWSASESGSDSWVRGLNYSDDFVYRHDSNQKYGFSARCVKD